MLRAEGVGDGHDLIEDRLHLFGDGDGGVGGHVSVTRLVVSWLTLG